MRCFTLAIACFVLSTLHGEISSSIPDNGVFKLPPLPYEYNALEPSIDTRTMMLHHDKHQQTYVDNLNKAVKGTKWSGKSLEELFADAKELPTSIRNNAGGVWNHTFYWDSMTGDEKKREISERLEKELTQYFGSVDKFKEQFRNVGLERFGSGYAWLIRTKDGELKIVSTPNQDNPLMNDSPTPGTPLLVCDVWEHAYYLKYQNRRGDYLSEFWDVVDFDGLDKRLFEKQPSA